MAGADRVGLSEFSKKLDERLGLLGDQLASGRYRPDPLRRIDIPKPSGGTRRLAIPSVRDRIAQTACAEALDKLLDPKMSRASFAYRRGLSVEDAIGRVVAVSLQGATHALDADIEKFFDRIPHWVLMQRLEPVIHQDATLSILRKWLGGFPVSGAACRKDHQSRHCWQIGIFRDLTLRSTNANPGLSVVTLVGSADLVDRRDEVERKSAGTHRITPTIQAFLAARLAEVGRSDIAVLPVGSVPGMPEEFTAADSGITAKIKNEGLPFQDVELGVELLFRLSEALKKPGGLSGEGFAKLTF